MPVYCFRDDTGRVLDLLLPMSEACDEMYAPEGTRLELASGHEEVFYRDVWLKRDYAAENKQEVATTAWEPGKSVSQAMGVHRSQIAEAQEADRRAGVSGVRYDRQGNAVYESRQARAKHIASLGMYDKDGGYTETKYAPKQPEQEPAKPKYDLPDG